MKKQLLSLVISLGLWVTTSAQINPAGSIVEQNGLLTVKGSSLVNQYNEPISLAGISLFWSQWGYSFYNDSCIQWLVDDWKCNIIRAAMGVEHRDGYLTSPAKEKAHVETTVDACIKKGIYVIIDWHSHKAHEYKDQSVAFFREMATKYGKYPNIIYEIYNEPEKVSWSKDIKPYAIDIVKAIREIDHDNLILVGDSCWDQFPGACANDPLIDNNVAYTFHFYVGSHPVSMSKNAIDAIDKGAPVFVSEWGLWGNDDEIDAWITFMQKYQLSACAWSLFTKIEPSSLLFPGAKYSGHWKGSDITDYGHKVRYYTRNWGTPVAEKPLLRYALVTNSSKNIDLYFSEPVRVNSGVAAGFSVTNTHPLAIESVRSSDTNKRIIRIVLKDAISPKDGSLSLSYAGSSVVADNRQQLLPFTGVPVQNSSKGAAPFVVSIMTDSMGESLTVTFNKPIKALQETKTSFEVKADGVSILQSVSQHDPSTLKLHTTRFFRENTITVSYKPGTISATDGGRLQSFETTIMKNTACHVVPKLLNIKLPTTKSVLLSFDQPLSIPPNAYLGLKITRVDKTGKIDTAQIESYVNKGFSIVLKLKEYLTRDDKVYVSYNNGLVRGKDSPFSIDSFNRIEATNTLPRIQDVEKQNIVRIEAEDYSEMYKIQTETTSDKGGKSNVGWIVDGSWMDYRVNVVDTGLYSITFRIASNSQNGVAMVSEVYPGVDSLLTITLPVTKGWQTWQSTSTNFRFRKKGVQTIKILAKTGGWNFNWIEIGRPVPPQYTCSGATYTFKPNAVNDGNVSLTSESGKEKNIFVTMYDIDEHLLFKQDLSPFNGNTLITLPDSIRAGKYFIRASNGYHTVSQDTVVIVK